MEKIGPFQIQSGPWAGLTLTGEIVRLPSGDWQIELTGDPWCDRFAPRFHRQSFPCVQDARFHLASWATSAREMSASSFIAPVTAY